MSTSNSRLHSSMFAFAAAAALESALAYRMQSLQVPLLKRTEMRDLDAEQTSAVREVYLKSAEVVDPEEQGWKCLMLLLQVGHIVRTL